VSSPHASLASPSRISASHSEKRWRAPCALVGLGLTAFVAAGCAPRGGTATRDDVVEIETIEVAAPPPAAEPAGETEPAANPATADL
jgi:hypothetical protein